jgi:hypothetical protein
MKAGREDPSPGAPAPAGQHARPTAFYDPASDDAAWDNTCVLTQWEGVLAGEAGKNSNFAAIQNAMNWAQAHDRQLVVPKIAGDYWIATPPGQALQCNRLIFFEPGAKFRWFPGGRVNGKGTPEQSNGTWDRLRDLEALLEMPQQNTVISGTPGVDCCCANGDLPDGSLVNLVGNGLVTLQDAARLADGRLVDLDLSNREHYPDYYHAFAPGFVAFKSVGHGTGRLVNAQAQGVKFGFVCDSEDGHWTIENPVLRGWLASIYFKRNSEDFKIVGTGSGATLANIIIGDQVWAGHNGGAALNIAPKHHLGYAPYGFLQVHDNYVDPANPGNFLHPYAGGSSVMPGVCGGIYGELTGLSWEQVGEARMRLLPNSVTSFNGGTETSEGWLTDPLFQLPDNLLPAGAKRRRALFWLGDVDQWHVDSLITFQPYEPAAGKVAIVRSLTARFVATDSSIAFMGDSSHVTIERKSDVAYGADAPGGTVARKADREITRSFLVEGNLLVNPQAPANWSSATQSRISVTTLAELIASGEIDPGAVPKRMYRALGGNPAVIRIEPAASDMEANGQLPLASPRAYPDEVFCFNVWIAYRSNTGDKAFYAQIIPAGTDPRIFSETVSAPRDRFVNRAAVAGEDERALTHINVGCRCDVMYVAGPMVSLHDIEPYSPASGPMFADVSVLPTSGDAALPGQVWRDPATGALYAK